MIDRLWNLYHFPQDSHALEAFVKELEESRKILDQHPKALSITVAGQRGERFCHCLHRIAVNDAFCEILGWSRRWIYGATCGELYHPEDAKLVHSKACKASLIASSKNPNRLITGSSRLRTNDKRWLRVDGKARAKVFGELLLVFCEFSPVTDDLIQKPVMDQLLPLRHACELLGMSESWLYKNHQNLPFVVRVGGRLKVSARKLERWLEEKGG